jgi:acetyltransferase
MLDQFEVLAVLQAYGIPTAPTLAVSASPDAAAAGAAHLGFPVALKIRSPDISHKSDVDGVKLDLRSEAELRVAVTAMMARVAELRPQARIDGFTLQRMLHRPLAQELIAGASIDSVFGPVVLFGHGGTAVEVIADRAIGLPPLNRVLALELVQRTRVAKLLGGYRDHPPAKLDAVCDTLIALSQMLADLPELTELDINPLWADHEGVIAVDARMRASRDARGGAASFAVTPYPSELVRQVHWRGETIVVRPVRPEDGPQHRAFTEQMKPEDLRLRFFSSRRELPRSELARLTQIDYAREMAFIATRALPDGTAQTLGVARAVCDPDNVEAEFAVIVRSDLKGQGLGHMLMQTLIDYLGQRRTQRIVGYVLRENTAMRDLAQSQGFEIDAPNSDAAVLRLVRSLQSG